VRKDGRISGAKILRGIGGGCDEEALRVVKKMPRWKPGTQSGKNIDVQFNIPIVFKLD
jgi:protein TonB